MIDLRDEFKESPYWKLLGMEIVKLEKGAVELAIPYKKSLDNVRQTIHGGVYMSLLDTTMGLLCRSVGYGDAMTMQMNTQFLKPVIEGSIHASATVISQTRSTMLVESKLFNEAKELIGFSTATFKVAE